MEKKERRILSEKRMVNGVNRKKKDGRNGCNWNYSRKGQRGTRSRATKFNERFQIL